jgi:tRNA pseudouridine38-40 synthase
MQRYALKFAYDGAAFHGYQRQASGAGRTVEGDIIDSLVQIGAIKGATEGHVRSSSRTDRGVSALGNAIALSTDFKVPTLIRALNGHLRDIWIHSYAMVDEVFDPRRATARWYRYLLPTTEIDPKRGIEGLRGALNLFVGTHDFTAFSRASDRDPQRTIERIEVRPETAPVNETRASGSGGCRPSDGPEGTPVARSRGPAGADSADGRPESGSEEPLSPPGFVVIDIYGQSFLWEMVRRVIGAAVLLQRGEYSASDVRSALKTGRRVVSPPAAQSEPLLLMDVIYEFPFIRAEEETEFLGGVLARGYVDAALRARTLRMLNDAVSPQWGGAARVYIS